MVSIIASIIIGLCLIGAALIISSAATGAAASLKESAPQALQQPTLKFFTEFDAADYLGVSLNELDYIRSEGLLDGSFMAVTSLEQTGEEEYYDVVDGLEVVKTRPVMSNVTRFLFNRELLDEKVCDIIRDGRHINPLKSRTKNAPKAGEKSEKPQTEKNAAKAEKAEAPAKDVVKEPVKTETPDDDVKEFQPKSSKNYEQKNKGNNGNNGNNGGNKNNNYNGNNGGNKNNNNGYGKSQNGYSKPNDYAKKNDSPRPESTKPVSAPAFSDEIPADAPTEPSPVFTHSDKSGEFPIAKQNNSRVVPKPVITVISSEGDGNHDDDMIDIMSTRPKK